MSIHAVSVNACNFLFGPWPLANGVNLEADIFEHSVIENDTPVEEEGWVHHRVIELVIWIRLELIPTDSCARLATVNHLDLDAGLRCANGIDLSLEHARHDERAIESIVALTEEEHTDLIANMVASS